MSVKEYSKLPVYIVDDHDKVLPFIHRAIGSKHLPFSGATMVHFDAHPDLLIENNMKASETFDKQHLYNSVSIATWLVPLLYAGHINTVVWVKPAWAKQITDGTYTFWVGECKQTGYIRLSCKENYFLSEALYVPEEELVNKKFVTLINITVDPDEWPPSPALNSDDSDTSFSSNSLSPDCQEDNNRALSPKIDLQENLQSFTNNQRISYESSDHPKSGCETLDTSTEGSASSVTTQQPSKGDQSEELPCVASSRECCESENKRTTLTLDTEFELSSKKMRLSPLSSDTKNLKTSNTQEHSSALYTPKDRNMHSNFKKIFSQLDNENALILDIDLDFFSTKNPFLEVYTEKQYQLLKKLYRFTEPKDTSTEAINECVQARVKQLAELEKMFHTLDKNPDAPISKSIERWELIEELIKSLHVSFPEGVDHLLVHDAGCTCDDTELPHHISSEEQIELLLQHTQSILSCLSIPTLVTIARSVDDEYCPPCQVEIIQEGVIRILEAHYTRIHLEKSYD